MSIWVGYRAAAAKSRSRSPLSGVQRGQRVVDQAIDLDSLVQQAFAAAEGTLAGDADFIDAGLPGNAFDAVDEPADLALELVERNRRSGLKTTNR